LVPLTAQGKLCASMQGLSLKNVQLRIIKCATGKTVYEDFGEMLFTHYGITGPLVLSASAHLSDIASGVYEASIDLKPALDEKTLDARIRSDFAKYQNRDLVNALDDLLPQKMIEPMLRYCGLEQHKKVNSVTKEERMALLQGLKALRIPLNGFRPLEEAIVTRGGVSVKEISPKTMASKLVQGLYFAGELIDVDAYTGGFNLQIAFSTSYVAGSAAAMGLS
jgi:predicted Rossmann fold flavoprotein